jgi:hypothetical protein
MKLSDRRLWERELAAHMRRYAADLHPLRQAPAKPGLWISVWMFLLWTLIVIIMTSVGWAVGLYVL